MTVVSDCTSCTGVCCRSFAWLQVEVDELHALAAALSVDVGALLNTHRWGIGDVESPGSPPRPAYALDMEGGCPFLSGGRCAVHAARPHACRDFKEGSEACREVQRVAAARSRKRAVVHAIEVTSRCNLACPYCSHSHAVFTRPKLDMDPATFEAALAWVDQDADEINLSGLGEPLLHPELPGFMGMVRARLGEDIQIVIPTNGILLDEAMIARLAPHRPRIYVSLHAPSRAARGVHLAREAGLLEAVSCDPVSNPTNQAGQVDWFQDPRRSPCPWLHRQQMFCASTGDLYACCMNMDGSARLGHVTEAPHAIRVVPWRCCSACHHEVPR